MKHHHHLYWAALTSLSDAAPRDSNEVHDLQQRAWEEDGLMIISCEDERLDDEDRIDLHRIGERLSRSGEADPVFPAFKPTSDQ